ncbi:MAG: hypothetical protein JWP82_3012, partial [Humibacillus sp.]|nr:hypothetical protein [Humibacillus sp.]
RQDTVNQSMWRTLAETKALAVSWKAGPVAFGRAVASVVGGDTNRTAADDLTISLVRSDVELEQTLVDEGRSRDLASALASIAATPEGAASAAALFAAGARRGPALVSSAELAAARHRERLDALAALADERTEERNRSPVPVRQPPTLGISREIGEALGELPRGRSAHTRTVGSEGELTTLFDELTRDATPMARGGYPGVSYRLDDGSVVRMRSESVSGGPTIDISLPDGSVRKVHVR